MRLLDGIVLPHWSHCKTKRESITEGNTPEVAPVLAVDMTIDILLLDMTIDILLLIQS